MDEGKAISLAVWVCVTVLMIMYAGAEDTSPHQTAPPPIPTAGPLARPKSLRQVGLPAAQTQAAIPADNAQMPEKIALGQKLFFDGRLSADGAIACASCHNPALAFTDGRPTSIGIYGHVGERNAPTILNALYNTTQFWDGRVQTLEKQAALPIINPIEMGQPSLDAAVTQTATIGEYQQAFQGVFGRPPNGPDLLRTIASYERTQPTRAKPWEEPSVDVNYDTNAKEKSADSYH